MRTGLGRFFRDLRYAGRSLRNNPGFAAVALLTLAFGMGANTAIFSVLEAVVLAPPPYADPDRLVKVQENNLILQRNMSVSYPDWSDWRREAQSFERMAVLRWQDRNLTRPGLQNT